MTGTPINKTSKQLHHLPSCNAAYHSEAPNFRGESAGFSVTQSCFCVIKKEEKKEIWCIKSKGSDNINTIIISFHFLPFLPAVVRFAFTSVYRSITRELWDKRFSQVESEVIKTERGKKVVGNQ